MAGSDRKRWVIMIGDDDTGATAVFTIMSHSRRDGCRVVFLSGLLSGWLAGALFTSNGRWLEVCWQLVLCFDNYHMSTALRKSI